MAEHNDKPNMQESYKAMVEAVEEFVVQEGKTLQQAFHSAEEKLINATENSKESIAHASQELKYNLHLFNDALEGASQAYKEHLLFEWDFINSALWDKFQSIANSNTAELMAFTKNLKEQAEAATTESHISAHQQHTQWDSEHAFWLDEIKLWKKNHQQAIAKLHEIEKAMMQQETILAAHTRAITKHAKLEQHIHTEQTNLHNKIKTKHLQTMAMINMLHDETHKTL